MAEGRLPTVEEQRALDSLADALNGLNQKLNSLDENLHGLSKDVREFLGLGPDVPDPRSTPLWLSLHRGPSWETAVEFAAPTLTHWTDVEDGVLRSETTLTVNNIFKDRVWLGWRNNLDEPAELWTDFGVQHFWKLRKKWRVRGHSFTVNATVHVSPGNADDTTP